VKDSQLTFKERDLLKNVVKVKTADDISKDYNANSILQTGMSRWQRSTQRQLFDGNAPVEETFSDLVEAVRIASCPHCKKLVPRFYFRNNVKCPACTATLADVPARPK
jgi:hypothetical protein